MTQSNYRSVEETYPYFDVMLSNDEIGGISAFDVSLYSRDTAGGGTKVWLRGRQGEIILKDKVKDFESRLFETLRAKTIGDVEESACPVAGALQDLERKTDEAPEVQEAPAVAIEEMGSVPIAPKNQPKRNR